MLLRSAKLVKATDEDIKKLTQDYNLGTIVDFRTTDEIADAPDPDSDLWKRSSEWVDRNG